MRQKWILGTLILYLLVLLVACGDGQQTTEEPATVDFLPTKAGEVVRSSEVRLFVGDSLWEYINGGAETYHQYGFVEVATAYYKLGETEIVGDVYKFDNSDHAYGLMSGFRPADPKLVTLGAGGFSSETSFDFVKGQYLIRITGYDQTENTATAIETLATELEKAVPGGNNLPATLTLFPPEGKLPNTDKLLAKSYLGQVFLNEVYTTEYVVGEDTVTRFLTEDQTGGKFTQWSEAVEHVDGPEGIAFDEGKSMMINNRFYGQIVAGVKGTWLAGVVGYKESHGDFLKAWIDGLQ